MQNAVRGTVSFMRVYQVDRHERVHPVVGSPLLEAPSAENPAADCPLANHLHASPGRGHCRPKFPTQIPTDRHRRRLTLLQHRQTNRLYRRMRIGAAQRELYRNNGKRFLAPGYAFVLRAEWLRRCSDTVLPKGAHFWYKSDNGLWWLGKISASTTEDGVYLVRFLDDPGPIKLPLPPARYTTSTGAIRGSWCLEVYEASAFPRGIQRNAG